MQSPSNIYYGVLFLIKHISLQKGLIENNTNYTSHLETVHSQKLFLAISHSNFYKTSKITIYLLI
jgi:hypothetical protein